MVTVIKFQISNRFLRTLKQRLEIFGDEHLLQDDQSPTKSPYARSYIIAQRVETGTESNYCFLSRHPTLGR